MRPRLVTLTATLAILAATAAPALADDGGVRGSFEGVALALVFGLIFGVAAVALAYRDASFGEEDAHHEHAHDIREGVGEYEPGVADQVGEEADLEHRGAP